MYLTKCGEFCFGRTGEHNRMSFYGDAWIEAPLELESVGGVYLGIDNSVRIVSTLHQHIWLKLKRETIEAGYRTNNSVLLLVGPEYLLVSVHQITYKTAPMTIRMYVLNLENGIGAERLNV